MRIHRIVLASSLMLWVLVVASTACAGELRILDGMGLTRAVKSVRDEGTVAVMTRGGGAAPGAVILSQVDGLAPDINPAKASDTAVVFERVPEGAWRIKTASSKVVITEVKIDQ